MVRNLVTGATGLVGSYLVRHLLAQGESVRALRRQDSDMGLVADVADRIEWVLGDLDDIFVLREAMDGMDRVYHCAALVAYGKRDREALMHTNVTGTAHVVDACLDIAAEFRR